MARIPFTTTVEDRGGNVIQLARVVLSVNETDTPVTDAFPSNVGGVAQSAFVTNADGQIKAWFDEPKYIRTTTTNNGGLAHYPGTPASLLSAFTEVKDDVRVEPSPVDIEQAETIVANWEDMQALSNPQDGDTVFTESEKVSYRYDEQASFYVKKFGNIDMPSVSDFGAKGDGDNTDASDAIEAANAEAFATTESPYDGRGTAVYFPRLGGASEDAGRFAITREIVRPAGVSWVGGNPRHTAQHARSTTALIDGSSIVGTAPAVSIHGGADVAVRIHDQNIGIVGNNIGLKLNQLAMYSSEYCWATCNDTADADNAGTWISNSFWLTFDHWNMVNGSAAAGQYALRIVAMSDGAGGLGGPIQGLANSTFRHGVMDLGGVVFENRTAVQGGDSEEVVWEDVLTESHLGQPWFTVLGGGDADHVLTNWEFIRDVRADSNPAGTGGSDSQTFIRMDSNGSAGRITLRNPKVRGCAPYSQWLIQCVGAVKPDVIGLDTDTAGVSGLVFDPSNEPYSRGRGLVWRGGSPAMQLGSGGGGDTATLNRVGGMAGNALSVGSLADDFNRATWGGDFGDIVWGDGTSATPDTNLYRNGVSQLKTDDKLLAALGIGVGNSAAATVPGTVTRKMEVFDASGASLGFVAIYDAIV